MAQIPSLETRIPPSFFEDAWYYQGWRGPGGLDRVLSVFSNDDYAIIRSLVDMAVHNKLFPYVLNTNKKEANCVVWEGEELGYTDQSKHRMLETIVSMIDIGLHQKIEELRDTEDKKISDVTKRSIIRFATEVGRFLGMNMFIESVNSLFQKDIIMYTFDSESKGHSQQVIMSRTKFMNEIMIHIYNNRQRSSALRKKFEKDVKNIQKSRMLDSFLCWLDKNEDGLQGNVSAEDIHNLFMRFVDEEGNDCDDELHSLVKFSLHIKNHNVMSGVDDPCVRKVIVDRKTKNNRYALDRCKLREFAKKMVVKKSSSNNKETADAISKGRVVNIVNRIVDELVKVFSQEKQVMHECLSQSSFVFGRGKHLVPDEHSDMFVDLVKDYLRSKGIVFEFDDTSGMVVRLDDIEA